MAKSFLIITSNATNFNIIIRKSGRSKNIILRFNNKDSAFQLTVPNYAKKSDITEFLQQSKPMIDDFIAKRNPEATKLSFANGVIVPIFAEPHLLQNVASAKINASNIKSLTIMCGAKNFEQATISVLKKMLLEYANARLSEIMQTPELTQIRVIPQLKLRNARTRFGSCQPKTGRIMLSTYLIFAPKSVIDSVLFHEVTHLLHANHSRTFWQAVQRIDCNYQSSKMWLKSHQSKLFYYSM
jgi:predicted metal-dependent hydrolase